MSSTVYRLAIVTLLFTFMSAANAAGSDPIVWLADNVSLAGLHQISLSIIDDTHEEHKDDPAKNIEQSVQDELVKHGVNILDKSASESQAVLSLQIHIVTYTPGSVGGRWLGFGGGAAACILRSYLVDTRKEEPVAEIIVAKQVSAGGLFSANAGQGVAKNAGKQIAQTLSGLFGMKKNELED